MPVLPVPHLDAAPLFLTDGGIETTLIFLEGLDLPHFAAFHLLRDEEGRNALRRYYVPYLELARERGTGFVLESATWRASRDWADRIGYTAEALDAANAAAIGLLLDLREQYADAVRPLIVSGNIGPRGDGYVADMAMSADEAEAYHTRQAVVLAAAGADIISGMTMTSAAEATGVVRAAQSVSRPVVIAFTTETDGLLPSGETLPEAIARVDGDTDGGPAYYMINCAHPAHFAAVLDPQEPWTRRIRGLRANASTRSHAELDEAPDLDAGDPQDLAARYAALVQRLPQITVLGGCCGTDHRHLASIADAVQQPAGGH